MVSAVLHPVLLALFLCAICFFLFVDLFHSGFSVPSFFLETIPCNCLDCSLFWFSSKHVQNWQWSDRRSTSCHLGQALPLWWGGTSYLVPPPQGTVCRGRNLVAQAQVSQCFGQSAQASPLGHFRHSGCLQWIRSAFWSFERCFAWAIRQKQVVILFWIALAPHGNARSRSPEFSWGKLNIFPLASAQTYFFSPCFWSDYSLPCGRQ